ncbi:MAG: AbrB/MazE/SpoVT family DNA-binding domain-containing protein [Anaeroplasma sp.]
MENLKVRRKNEIRTISELGQIVIPLVKRKELKINAGDKLEIYRSGNNIILKKIKVDIRKDIIEKVKAIINNEIELDIKVKRIKTNIDKSYNKDHSLRTIDELGRVIIPIELRKELNIMENDKMKICIKDNMIILIKIK